MRKNRAKPKTRASARPYMTPVDGFIPMCNLLIARYFNIWEWLVTTRIVMSLRIGEGHHEVLTDIADMHILSGDRLPKVAVEHL